MPFLRRILYQSLKARLFVYIFLSCLKSSDVQAEILAKMLCQVDKELVKGARRETNSVLRARGYGALSTLSFTEIIKEIQTLCPTVFSLLSQMIFLSSSPGDKTVPLALIYGIIMFNRCKEMSQIQRVHTVLRTEGDASKQVHYF